MQSHLGFLHQSLEAFVYTLSACRQSSFRVRVGISTCLLGLMLRFELFARPVLPDRAIPNLS